MYEYAIGTRAASPAVSYLYPAPANRCLDGLMAFAWDGRLITLTLSLGAWRGY